VALSRSDFIDSGLLESGKEEAAVDRDLAGAAFTVPFYLHHLQTLLSFHSSHEHKLTSSLSQFTQI
jgi:hypothetical protein